VSDPELGAEAGTENTFWLRPEVLAPASQHCLSQVQKPVLGWRFRPFLLENYKELSWNLLDLCSTKYLFQYLYK
jgi:hypothetical protein